MARFTVEKLENDKYYLLDNGKILGSGVVAPDYLEELAASYNRSPVWITRDLNRMVVVSRPSFFQIDDLTRHAIHTFGYLVSRGQSVTLVEFSDRIARQYSMDNPKTRATVDHLREVNRLWLEE